MHLQKPGTGLDKDMALARVDGDSQLLSELASMFVQDYPRLIQEASEAVLQGNHSTLERTAHTLKGRLAFFGIMKLQDQVSNLETMGREEDLTQARQALDEVESEMKSILMEFESLIRELGS
jgi:HPt (histidine-containing phosphotransfer) domain-containing protein